MLEKISSPKDLKHLNNDELTQLADEIRHFLIERVSKTGGHLASNLGVVELTIALHAVFDAPMDKIIWDVGHQTYVHKILTGRKDGFLSLRQLGGLSGYPKIEESPYDAFGTGHSSTSISAALGMVRARNIKGENYHVVAVIGDGALTGGMAFEALNDAGRTKTQLMVVLNDNEMSISKNVGSLSMYLSKLRTDPAYFKMKADIDKVLNRIPEIGSILSTTLQKFKNSVKSLLVPGMIFENLGFTYFGPIDGHDISVLKEVLSSAKTIKSPVLVHVITKKGKGYKNAEEDPEYYHGVEPFDIKSGECVNARNNKTYSEVFGDTLVELAKKDKNIVAITAAMPYGTGLSKFKEIFPDRFFDVGIAEQHAVTMAGGMAAAGLKPVFAVYSTFLQRGYDQIVHDICLQKLPVVFAIDRAGIVGEDGETHNGVFDISYLSHIPNITILSPKDGNELSAMLRYALTMNRPVAIRYPRDNCYYEEGNLSVFNGKSEILRKGEDLTIIAEGRMVKIALKIAEILESKHVSPEIINARILKPLDEDTIISSTLKTRCLVTIEDNVKIGGMGSNVIQLLNEKSIYNIPIKVIGWPDQFICHGKVQDIFKFYGMDAESLANQISAFLTERGKHGRDKA